MSTYSTNLKYNMFNYDIANKLKFLGPGMLTASAAIGTSHLVQATRAGAYFGFELLFMVIIINIIKYPFIECGYRYISATGNNILVGYKKLNPKLLFIFLTINFFSSFIAIAAVSYICAGILQAIFTVNISSNHLTIIIIIFTAMMIIIGHYKLLNQIMKYAMLILLFATFIAVLMIIDKPIIESDLYYKKSAFNFEYIPFMLALMGWMPGPIELSVWHSLWLEAHNKNNKKLIFKNAKIDFNIGYFITFFTAILFLILGAKTLYISGKEISDNNVIFAQELITTYVNSIGLWSQHIIAIIIAITILSTTMTLIDIYPRTLAVGLKTMQNKLKISQRNLHIIMILFSSIIAIIIILFTKNFKTLLDIITIIAFLSAPLFAYMNYSLLHKDFIEKKYQPNKYTKLLSQIGLVFLIVFSFIFLLHLLFY